MPERKRSIRKIEVEQFDSQKEGIELIIASLNGSLSPEPMNPEISKRTFLNYIEATANNNQISAMQEDLWDFIDGDDASKEIYIDDPQDELLYVSLIESPFLLRLTEAELASAAHDGYISAADSILELFSPELRSNPQSKIDFIPWRRDLAELYLDKAPTSNNNVYWLPTNVPGAVIEYFYPEESNFPLRSVFIRRK